jgi:hypothetical protein
MESSFCSANKLACKQKIKKAIITEHHIFYKVLWQSKILSINQETLEWYDK